MSRLLRFAHIASAKWPVFSRRMCVVLPMVMMAAAVFISGCASLPVVGALPEGVAIAELGRVDEGSPLAWHPGGGSFLYSRGALRRYDLKDGTAIPLAAEPGATAAAWSPDGLKLALSYGRGNESLLRLMGSDGKTTAEAKVAGRITQLAWRSGDELLAAAVALKNFSFGANFSGVLYRWDGKGEPSSRTLVDTTLKFSTAAMPKHLLLGAFSFTLSPFGDEIAYTKLIDPPQYPGRLKLMLLNLETGGEREVHADLALTSGGAAFSADGEQLYYGDGTDKTALLDPWTGGTTMTFPSPGAAIALSPANLHLLLDGVLYRQQSRVATFPAPVRGAFSPDGSRLLLKYEDHLYLVSGLSEAPVATMPPTVRERLLQLRKWRSEGLVSVPEFEAAKRKLMQ